VVGLLLDPSGVAGARPGDDEGSVWLAIPRLRRVKKQRRILLHLQSTVPRPRPTLLLSICLHFTLPTPIVLHVPALDNGDEIRSIAQEFTHVAYDIVHDTV